MHQTLILHGHGNDDLLERIVVVCERENVAQSFREMVEKHLVQPVFDSIVEQRQLCGESIGKLEGRLRSGKSLLFAALPCLDGFIAIACNIVLLAI